MSNLRSILNITYLFNFVNLDISRCIYSRPSWSRVRPSTMKPELAGKFLNLFN